MKGVRLLMLGIITLALPRIGLAETLPTLNSFSTEFISVTSETPYQATLAVYGENLGYLLNDAVTIELGPLVAASVSGNSTGMNITFTIDRANITAAETNYPLVISNSGVAVVTSTSMITLYNPYALGYKTNSPRLYLNSIDRPHKHTKQTIGLNVHWTLGGDSSLDAIYAERLHDSKTVWAREHFSYKLIMGENSAAWLKRYDQTMLRYSDNDSRVVGMLAYGAADDEFSAPAAADWKRFVRTIVKRYRNYVDVWEIWNEPDSATYLRPNTWKTYRPLLKVGSSMIREYDPDAIVLNGAVADISDHSFTNKLYSNGSRYFDELNVHLYYCDEYRDDDKNLERLAADWESYLRLVRKYRPHEPIWITELGCSTGLDDVNNKFVKHYLRAATTLLLQYNNIRPILLYTIRDRMYLDTYEAEFGLLTESGQVKPAWRWYKLLREQ